MRSLLVRVSLFMALIALPSMAFAQNVTLSGNVEFSSIDGSVDDADHTANGVFTVNGDLTVNGTVNCNDELGRTSACSMSFNVGRDLIVNAGGALFAENRTGSGTGGAITLSVGRDLVLHGPSGTLAGALISTDSKSSSGSIGGNVTATVARDATIEDGATVTAAAANAQAGAISVVAGGHLDVSGNVLSGPSRTLLSTRLTDVALSGGTNNQIGGAITLTSNTFSEPGVTIGSNASIVSQGETNGAGPVKIQGCGVVVKGLVAGLARKDATARVAIRSGKWIQIDSRDLGVTGATLGRNGHVRADAPTGTAINHTLDLFANTNIDILGPPAASSSLFSLTGLPGVHDSKSDGALIRVIALDGAVTASGNVADDGRAASGDDGGNINISAKGNLNFNTAVILSFGDTNTSNPSRGGGTITLRSYSGNVVWTNGLGDVRPTGSASGVAAAAQGQISITACGTISLAGSSFPTNGAPVGTWPAQTTGACSPAGPSLPSGEPALPVCNTPPVANNGTATTNEDNCVTVTMTGSDADGDPLTFSIVSGPSHGTLGAIFNQTTTSAQVTYCPDANYNGGDSFVFQVDDGKGGTSNGTVTITINPVNDPPTFNLGANPVTSLEDAGLQTIPGYASSISPGPTADESSQTVTFTVTNDNPALFTVQPAIAPNGTLTYQSALNANGGANVTVVAHDSGGTANGGNDTSTPHNFNIVVTPVNDPPSFVRGADQTSNEDAGPQTVANWATAISAGPADEAGQTVTFTATNNNNALFSAQPAVASNGTLTYTAAPNANGTATVTVTAHDNGGTAGGGNDSSAPQTFTITIIAVNDPPSFTSGGNVTVLEDSGAYNAPWATAISPGPADESGQTVNFTATNDNNALFSAQPAVAPNGALTFTPSANAFGTATVTVTAHDSGGTLNGGNDTSAPQTFTITVTPVNDAPSFTSGGNVTVLEDSGAFSAAWATAISAGPNEGSQTVNFVVTNDNNALFSSQPAVSPSGVLTFATATNANGTATVTVTLHDDGGTANGGVDTSAPQTFTITITAVNDPPSFTSGGNVTVLEDSGLHSAPWATGISAGPADESGQVVTFNTSNDNNALFTVQPTVASNGTLTFTPAANAFGTATVTVTAQDNGGTLNGGNDTSAPQTFTITVTPVNDAPSFTGGGNVSVLEDSGAYAAAWASSISAGPNEGSQTVNFIVTNDNNALFSSQPVISPSGVLSFTPAPNANGTTTVTVTLHDDGGTANGGVDTSASQTFTITVVAVNDPPSFTKGADQTVLEDSGAQTVPGWATGISAGPADESGQTVTFTTANNNNALFSVQPSVAPDGTLTYTPAADAFGTATVTVTAHDNGGTLNGGNDTSAPQTFTITITPVNDAPSFTKGPDVSANDNAAAQTFPGWATAISAGPANESGQTVNFVVTGNTHPEFFTVQPAVSSTGTLTFDPAPNHSGVATITIVLHDNGGVANGGVDTSAPQTFTITLNHVNNPPVATNDSYDTIGNTTLEVSGAQALTGSVFVTGSVLANDNDGGDGPGPLTASLNSASAGAIVTVNSDGTFTYVPPAGLTGSDSFVYNVSDGSDTTTGTVTITIKGRVWYVKNDGGGTSGRSHDPFPTLAQAETASVAGDIVYVFRGDGTTNGQNAGFTAKNNQRLLGSGVALDVAVSVNGGPNPTILRTAGAPAFIGNSGGNGVTITNVSAEVAGLDISASMSGILASTTGASAGTAKIHDVTVSTATANGVRAAANSSGILTVSVDNSSVNALGNAIDARSTNGELRIGVNNTSISSTGGDGVYADGTGGGVLWITAFANNSVSGNTIGNGINVNTARFDAIPGLAFNVVNGGTLSIGSAGNGVGGSGVVLTNVSGDLSFTNLDEQNDAGSGVSVAGTGAFTGSAGFRLTTGGGSISATGGSGLSNSNATLNMTLSSLTATADANGISLGSGSTGSVSIAGGSIALMSIVGVNVSGGNTNLSYGGSITSVTGRPVMVSGATGGTINLSGSVTGTGNGVSITGNAASTSTNFSGTLSLTTSSNVGFVASSGGTITVTGSGNTILTTTATALNVVSTTIGAANLNFRSISAGTAATGPLNGIVLDTTGSLGGLTVTGNGAASTGGTIQKTTGPGIRLNATKNVSLTFMDVKNGTDDGINGTAVDGLGLSNCNVTGNGDSGTDEGVQLTNSTGAINLSNSTFSGNAHNNFWMSNTSTAVSAFNATGTTFATNSAAFGNDGLLLETFGSATIGASAVTSCSFTGNKATGLQLAMNGGTLTMLDVSASTFTNNNIHADFSKAGTASISFKLRNSNLMGANAQAINVNSTAGAGTGGTLGGRIEGNTIGNALIVNSGSAIGNGMRININGQTAAAVLVDNNVIRQTPNGRSIEAIGRNGTGGLDVTITNNDANPQDTSGFPLAAIFVQSNAATVANTVRADIRGNTVPAGVATGEAALPTFIAYVKTGTSTAQLVDTPPASPNATAQLTSTNTGSASASATVTLIPGPINVP